MFVLSTA